MLDKAADVILKEGGLWAALLIVVASTMGGAIIFLYREMRKGERVHRKQVAEMMERHGSELSDLQAKREKVFEERMKESASLILALDTSSKANLALENSSNQRILALEKFSAGFAALSALLDARDERIVDHLKDLQRMLTELRGAPR